MLRERLNAVVNLVTGGVTLDILSDWFVYARVVLGIGGLEYEYEYEYELEVEMEVELEEKTVMVWMVRWYGIVWCD